MTEAMLMASATSRMGRLVPVETDPGRLHGVKFVLLRE